jgi:histone-lysine N-methyltransferase SETMAR
MTKVGFTVMIHKQSNSRRSGRAHNHQAQKRRGSSTKSTLTAFLNVKGTVLHESVSPNTAVNSDFYCDVLRRLREIVRWKRPGLWRNHKWFLRHNAPAHTSLKTTELVTNNNMVIIPHPPYSPDLAPLWFSYVLCCTSATWMLCLIPASHHHRTLWIFEFLFTCYCQL